MKIKTSELIDITLDYAVAIAEGYGDYDAGEPCEKAGFFSLNGDYSYCLFLPDYSPSTNWSQGGPIMERERLSLHYSGNKGRPYYATHPNAGRKAQMDGPTPLVAAMRCYVASKLGNEVEVPDEIQ